MALWYCTMAKAFRVSNAEMQFIPTVTRFHDSPFANAFRCFSTPYISHYLLCFADVDLQLCMISKTTSILMIHQ